MLAIVHVHGLIRLQLLQHHSDLLKYTILLKKFLCMVLHVISLYCMVLHGIVLYSVFLHGIALSCTVVTARRRTTA